MSNRQTRSGTIKVCHIALGDLWAGAEVQLATLLRYLVRMPGFELSVILLNDGKLADELRSLRINVVVISERDHSAKGILAKLIAHFRKNAIDVVHTHKYKDNILGAIAARLTRVPYVVRMVHGLSEPFSGVEYVRMALYELVDGFVNKYLVDKLVAVSSNIEQCLKKRYKLDKSVCIHNGIDLEKTTIKNGRWETRRQLQVDQNCRLIGTVGRLTRVKGHENLLKAISLLGQERRNLKCLLVGDGPSEQRLKELAIQLGIEHDVMFTGHRQNVYDLINAMDIVVLPSIHEGIPMVLLEALALERPVVASRVGGIPEVIEHRVSGLLVNPGDVQELAQSLLALFNDKPFAESIGKAGRRRVEEEFTAELMAQKTSQVYQALVFEGGSR